MKTTKGLHVRDLSPAMRAKLGLAPKERNALDGAKHRQSRATGDTAERIVERAIATAQAGPGGHHIHILRRPTPFKVIGQKGATLTCVPDRKQGVDFSGDIAGRAIYLEVKVCDSARLPKSRITREQGTELDEAIGRGAIAWLVVVHKGRAVALEWRTVYGRGSLDVREMVDLAGMLTACVEVTRCHEWAWVMP